MVMVHGPAADVIDRRRELLVAAAADRSAAHRYGRWFLVTNAPTLARIAIDVGDGVHAVVSGTSSGWWWHVECGTRLIVSPRRSQSLRVALVLSVFRAAYERGELEVRCGSEDYLRDGGGSGSRPAGGRAGDVRRPDGQPVPADGRVPACPADRRRAPVAA